MNNVQRFFIAYVRASYKNAEKLVGLVSALLDLKD